jgi:FkbM family methyltransferase
MFRQLPAALQRPLKHFLLLMSSRVGITHPGDHFIFDLKTRLRKPFDLIFDVGGNVGQSIAEYRVEFPSARIESFEPDPKTFVILKRRFPPNELLNLHNIGLSNREAELRFDNNSTVTELHRIAADQNDRTLPTIRVTTIDLFCRQHSIGHIDLLKIDTEGHDLNVMEGAAGMLRAQAIDVLICECSLLTSNDSLRHVPFTKVHEAMGAYGYVFFGIYNQAADSTGVDWGNCAYVSRTMSRYL